MSAPALARGESRHSHISIGLRLHQQDRWEPLQALGWNAEGFNFYHPHAIEEPDLLLKRHLTPFAGRIVWAATSTSDAVLAAALLNERLHRAARQRSGDAALQQRLLKLMRVSDMLAQKQAVLAALGQPLSDGELAELLAQRRQERPLYHYGVRVDDQAWRATVQKAANLSAAVAALEQWADAFSRP